MKVRAKIHLLDQEDGGLADAIPSPCQSLLMHLGASPEGDDGVDLGIRIATSMNCPLVPGAELDATLEFWSDVADLHVIPGQCFELRYPIRVVGHGEVLEVVSF